jgi:hypothetical protein
MLGKSAEALQNFTATFSKVKDNDEAMPNSWVTEYQFSEK